MAGIIIISGEQRGQFLRLGSGTRLIGRDPGDRLQVDDPTVSRKHMRIVFDEDLQQYWAVDNHSSGGVCIDGNKISGKAGLWEGVKILIGKTDLLFILADPAEIVSNDDLDGLTLPRSVGEREEKTELD